MSLEILNTSDGGTVSEYLSAFDYASRLLNQAGFELTGASGLSRSRYYARPGHDDWQIRIADHDNQHPYARDHVVELRLTARREEVAREFKFDGDDGPEITIDREWELVIVETAADIAGLVAEAIAEYDALPAAEDEEGEDA